MPELRQDKDVIVCPTGKKLLKDFTDRPPGISGTEYRILRTHVEACNECKYKEKEIIFKEN